MSNLGNELKLTSFNTELNFGNQPLEMMVVSRLQQDSCNDGFEHSFLSVYNKGNKTPEMMVAPLQKISEMSLNYLQSPSTRNKISATRHLKR
jgi:hypothetical protein